MALENYKFLQNYTEKIINGVSISHADAFKINDLQGMEEVLFLLAHANRLRHHFRGNVIDLCGVVNAKSGKCSEDCIFCAQSAHYHTSVKQYPLLTTKGIVEAAESSQKDGARRFGIVTSGRALSTGEIERIAVTLETLKNNSSLEVCASLGMLSAEHLFMLKKAGLSRYHHNLETAPSYFDKICSTHSFSDRVETIRNAKRAGLEVCCGGIFGIGETAIQRIELAFFLKDLDVDSIPLNFLHPVEGTPAADFKPIAPVEILKTIAVFRFILPDKEIRVCGGRETGLRTLQPLMYLAGANATMVGNYLTTSGRDPSDDLQEIVDLGLTFLKRDY